MCPTLPQRAVARYRTNEYFYRALRNLTRTVTVFPTTFLFLAGPYFTAVDLGAIAQHLDDEERMVMAEGDLESEEYKNFLKVTT